MEKSGKIQRTDWADLFKIKIANPDDSFQKHEVVKLLITMKILRKYNNRHWIRIYTEKDLGEVKPDIYFEDIKSKSVICYEIQKIFTKDWLEKKTKQYNNLDIPFFTVDFIPIKLKDLSENISELNKELDKYVF